MGVSFAAAAAGQPWEVEELDQGAPRRRIPFILAGALLLWGAAACAFSALPVEAASVLPFAVICCALAGAAAVTGVLTHLRTSTFAAAFVLAGCALGAAATLQLASGYAAADEGVPVTGFITLQDSTKSEYGFSTLCEAQIAEGARVQVRLLTGEEEGFLAGEALTGDARLSPLKEEARAFYRTQGVCAQVKASDLTRISRGSILDALQGMRARSIESIRAHAGDAAPLVCALVCGFRQDLSGDALYERFKTCGLAHLVAVSGAHTSIVLMMLMWLLRALRSPRWLTVTLSVLFVGVYVVFAGMPVSAVRSALMSLLALTSFFAKRRSASLNAIGLCVLTFIITNPAACLSVSLFLSAGSTLGIVLFASLIASWFPRTPERLRTAVVQPLSLTFSSNLVTMPFSAALFSQASFIAPLANVLAAPVFALSCTAGLASCVIALAFPPMAGPVIGAASLAALPLIIIVDALSCVPFAATACSLDPVAMICLSVIVCTALWIAWPRPSVRLLGAAGALAAICLGGILILGALPKGNEAVALDVGQGDAILIRSGTANVLIDTGNSDASLREELGRLGVRRLDAVVITHPDDDHCASLATLGGYMQVDRICFAEGIWSCGCTKCARLLELADACAPFAEKRGLSVGDELAAGAFTLRVIWPDAFTDAGGNADSVCLLGEVDCDADGVADWRALFTGDAESEELDRMIQAGRVGDIDLLKVGHHGSKVSLTDENAAQIHPEAALISCGANNRYGHPSQEALNCLDAIRCPVFRTDEQGTITVTFTKEAMSVAVRREAA